MDGKYNTTVPRGSDGGLPTTGVTFDPSGNLFAGTLGYGSGDTGTVVELLAFERELDFNLFSRFSGACRAAPARKRTW